MAWTVPQFSRSQVDRAGEFITSPIDADDPHDDAWWKKYGEALNVVNNWRSSHSFPLNTFQVGLRERGRQVTSRCLVAQRIKRLSSIEAKLRRFPTMKLSQVQDIGGCRAIVQTVAQVERLVELYEVSSVKHRLYDIDDYILEPQDTGYRGIHLKYRYFSDRQTTYNGLRIEIQIRSQLQHAWATAVETVGTFIKQALKSSQGEEKWLRFFALMGSAIARREKTEPVPGTPSRATELRSELRGMASELKVRSRLSTYGEAIQTLSEGPTDAHYYLLKLDPNENRVTVTGFRARELQKASAEYLEVEKSIKGDSASDAVLVSVDSIEALRRAYPNYFLDTKLFIDAVDQALT